MGMGGSSCRAASKSWPCHMVCFRPPYSQVRAWMYPAAASADMTTAGADMTDGSGGGAGGSSNDLQRQRSGGGGSSNGLQRQRSVVSTAAAVQQRQHSASTVRLAGLRTVSLLLPRMAAGPYADALSALMWEEVHGSGDDSLGPVSEQAIMGFPLPPYTVGPGVYIPGVCLGLSMSFLCCTMAAQATDNLDRLAAAAQMPPPPRLRLPRCHRLLGSCCLGGGIRWLSHPPALPSSSAPLCLSAGYYRP